MTHTRPSLHRIAAAALAIIIGALPACAPARQQLLLSDESQLKLRSIQSRVFDTSDRVMMLRAIMATLQDLGFVIDHADETLGTVSATQLDRFQVRMTVSVRPRGHTQLLVRANAQYDIRAVEDAEPYQRFFDALGKSVFLAAHQVD